ncbi:MAG: hypothetical protein SPH44_10585 [Eubacteriales bacterium]|nr:hypothetical protein [Eubacteriales bacterium]
MKQNIIARLFKMIGNISKKKGDNGDFYTKPVVDKKIKEAEAAAKAYTDKAAADAKNDLYAEVGEKVGAVEETVKARLDSTDTKLDTKVDKVSGKSLIDSGVADNLEYDTDKEELLLKVSEPSQGLRVKSTAFSESTQITSGSITIESDASGLGNYLTLSPFGGIMINSNNENADVRLVKAGETHRLSQKADKTDLANKVDKVNGKTLIDKNVANKFSEETTIPNGVKLDGNLLINNTVAATGEVAIREYSQGLNGYTFTHKLSEKANAADVGTLSDLTTTDKSSIVAAINEVKSSGGGDVLDNLTYDSTKDIINSSANLLLENSASVAAYNGTFRGDITIGQLGANKWAYRISPITGFSTCVDVTCTSGNVVHNLAAKADTTNVLTRNNTQTFTPTGDYQPATKKYVDDAIAALKLELGLD